LVMLIETRGFESPLLGDVADHGRASRYEVLPFAKMQKQK
jgi:hypothetical protein